jgi:hypothetical protein
MWNRVVGYCGEQRVKIHPDFKNPLVAYDVVFPVEVSEWLEAHSTLLVKSVSAGHVLLTFCACDVSLVFVAGEASDGFESLTAALAITVEAAKPDCLALGDEVLLFEDLAVLARAYVTMRYNSSLQLRVWASHSYPLAACRASAVGLYPVAEASSTEAV